eukprot:1158436-Pelagomonas_calceolata.AAC.1
MAVQMYLTSLTKMEHAVHLCKPNMVGGACMFVGGAPVVERRKCHQLTAVGALLGMNKMATRTMPTTNDQVVKNRLRRQEGLQAARKEKDDCVCNKEAP